MHLVRGTYARGCANRSPSRLVAKGDDQIRDRGSRGCAAARRRTPAAQARDPLAGGTTTLKLDAGVAKALKAAGVKVSGTEYRITGGSLDSSGATGTINHSGSLQLSAGGKR